MKPVERIVHELRRAGCRPHRLASGEWEAACPVHEMDGKRHDPSVRVDEGREDRGLIYCHAGCATEEICRVLGLEQGDLFAEPAATNGRRIVGEYTYFDENGVPLYDVLRLEPKTFRQRRSDWQERGTWKLSVAPRVRTVLYRLLQVIEAVQNGQTIYIAEGEKDVHALESAGVVATCNPGGAAKWKSEYTPVLAGATVVIVADRDEAGYAHAHAVAASLTGIAKSVQVVEAAEGKDAADHLAAGHGIKAFVPVGEAVDGGPAGEPEAPYTPPDVRAHLHTPPPLASDLRILDTFARVLRVCGVVGERRNAQLMYLAFTSRVLPEPVSLALKGTSSSGKSHTLDTVRRFVPESAFLLLTGMSEKALIYEERDFAHRTLVIIEATALRERREARDGDQTAYFLRTLLSEGRIDYPVTMRGKDGEFRTRHIVKNGPCNVILTTTATTLHGENETRLLSLSSDDSTEQTRRVLRQIADDTDRELDFHEWHELQEWLASEAADRRVVIPYAGWLAEQIPPVAVRLRRDFKALLRLIQTHAILHQATRERDGRGRIIATEDDYLTVRGLVADLISDGIGATVSATIRGTVEVVRSLANDHLDGVTTAAVAGVLKLDRSAVQRRLASARERGYITNREEREGRPARYAIGDPMPEEVELLPTGVPGGVHAQPEGARTASCPDCAGHEGVCRCARAVQGVESGPSPEPNPATDSVGGQDGAGTIQDPAP